ncbi:MAG: acyl-CoA thioesterase [Spirochaetaceae bacterium]|jgi:acyl-CoA thioester hydrolase|nr:acyl-CoA thioesterase [Spirochaetaceae bacterium]
MFTITVTPRFGDVDGLGHINNAVMSDWFELARNPVFKLFDPEMRITHEYWSLIMAHTDYDFVDQIFFQHEVEIKTAVDHIGTKSFSVYHEAWQRGRLCAKGHAVLVHYDFINKKSTPLPEEKKKLLAEHMKT